MVSVTEDNFKREQVWMVVQSSHRRFEICICLQRVFQIFMAFYPVLNDLLESQTINIKSNSLWGSQDFIILNLILNSEARMQNITDLLSLEHNDSKPSAQLQNPLKINRKFRMIITLMLMHPPACHSDCMFRWYHFTFFIILSFDTLWGI